VAATLLRAPERIGTCVKRGGAGEKVVLWQGCSIGGGEDRVDRHKRRCRGQGGRGGRQVRWRSTGGEGENEQDGAHGPDLARGEALVTGWPIAAKKASPFGKRGGAAPVSAGREQWRD
jgi:hypothetical protein